jgi:hypothetical protein
MYGRDVFFHHKGHEVAYKDSISISSVFFVLFVAMKTYVTLLT